MPVLNFPTVQSAHAVPKTDSAEQVAHFTVLIENVRIMLSVCWTLLLMPQARLASWHMLAVK
jgi:hypothetical protein